MKNGPGKGTNTGRDSARHNNSASDSHWDSRSNRHKDKGDRRGRPTNRDGRDAGRKGRRPPDDQMVVFGIHPVQEFLSIMPEQIRYVLIDGKRPAAAVKVSKVAAQKGIPVREGSPDEFSEFVGYGHAQGIVAVLKPLKTVDGEELIEQVVDAGDGLLVALDSVQDPQNLGSILRTAAFFGVAGVIITSDRSVRLTSSAVKASAGGAARVPVGEVTNLARTLKKCTDLGMSVTGTVVSGGSPLAEVPNSGPRVVVLGSEGAGMRRLVAESCSMLVTVPSPAGFDSLNVGVTAGILVCAATTEQMQVVRPGY